MIAPKLLTEIQRHLPLSSVDVVIIYEEQMILTKRAIPPFKGYWHLPGGIVQRDEKLIETVRRIARQELGISVRIDGFIGYYEIITQLRHYISHLFIAHYISGELNLDFQASDMILTNFKDIPLHTIKSHKKMIQDAKQWMKNKNR